MSRAFSSLRHRCSGTWWHRGKSSDLYDVLTELDVAEALTKLLARTPVLDDEVAIYDQQLRSRFDWLREPDTDAVASPPLFMAFDMLYQDGAT
jgi:ATP-dependent DNA ligase